MTFGHRNILAIWYLLHFDFIASAYTIYNYIYIYKQENIKNSRYYKTILRFPSHFWYPATSVIVII